MNFETISSRDIDRYVDNDQFYIIDMRAASEFRKGHITGAVNIPYSDLNTFAYYPREKEYILYCTRGGISLQAARQLGEAGYKVKTVIGGIHMYNGPNYIFDTK